MTQVNMVPFSPDLGALEKALNITFTDKELLQSALTHKSFPNKGKAGAESHNERLEFLGDAVLKLIISEHLYLTYPKQAEGELTKLRAQLISDKLLGKIGKSLNIGQYMRFSYGEKQSGGATRPSNIGDAIEAILGAYYLDQGLEKTKVFLLKLIKNFESELPNIDLVDYKTTLQEFCQKNKVDLPSYTLEKEEGPDHEKIFHIYVSIEHKAKVIRADGKGNNKKEAEQKAAKHALDQLKKAQ